MARRKRPNQNEQAGGKEKVNTFICLQHSVIIEASYKRVKKKDGTYESSVDYNVIKPLWFKKQWSCVDGDYLVRADDLTPGNEISGADRAKYLSLPTEFDRIMFLNRAIESPKLEKLYRDHYSKRSIQRLLDDIDAELSIAEDPTNLKVAKAILSRRLEEKQAEELPDEWRPGKHKGYPPNYRAAMRALCLLAKALGESKPALHSEGIKATMDDSASEGHAIQEEQAQFDENETKLNI